MLCLLMCNKCAITITLREMLSTKTHALSFSLPLLSFSFSLLIKVFHPSLSFASCTFIVMIIIYLFFLNYYYLDYYSDVFIPC